MESFNPDLCQIVKDRFKTEFYCSESQNIELELHLGTKNFRGCELEMFKGILKAPSGTKKCFFYRLEGPRELTCNYAQDQLFSNSLLSDFPYFERLVGFSLGDTNESNSQFCLAYKLYPHTFEKVKGLELEKKVDIIFNLFRALHILKVQHLFHGGLSDNYISFDKYWIPKIRLSPFIQSTQMYQIEKLLNYMNDIINFGDIYSTFLSPELILSLSALPKNYIVDISAPKKSDLFAIGVTCCIILGYNPLIYRVDINNIQLNFEILVKNSLKFDDLQMQNNLRKIKKKIFLSNFDIDNFVDDLGIQKIQGLLKSSLKIEMTCRILENHLIPSVNFEELQGNRSNKELIIILAKETIPILTKIGNNQFFDVQKKLQSILEHYYDDFRFASESYYSTKCKNKTVKVLDGVVLFFYHLFSLLTTEIEYFLTFDRNSENKGGLLISFQATLLEDFEKILYFPKTFINFFENLLEAESLKKNYITQSLLIFKLQDWRYFFSSDLLQELNFLKFSICPHLKQEFSQLINKSIIFDILIKFLPENKNLEKSLERIMQNTYITKLFPSACGFSTYNYLVFLNSNYPGKYNKNFCKEDIRYRAVLYIIFFHECGHLLRRLNFKTIKEAKNAYTPPDAELDERKVYENTFKIKEDLKKNRGESGLKAETALFGRDIKFITFPAAKYLINFDAGTQLEEFQKKFWTLNKQELDSAIEITRLSPGGISLFKCAYANISHYCENYFKNE